MERHGVVLKKLRAIRGLQIRQAAELIKRSPGWLSEIENERGEARIYPAEFERIVSAYDAEKYRKQFSIWIANASNPSHREPEEIAFTGAILKFVREKAGLSIKVAAKKIGFADHTYLSKLENGRSEIPHELRDRIMRAYGYSPASFRNYATEDKRAKSVPPRYKLQILLNQMSDDGLRALFTSALQIHQQHRLNSEVL